jgi:hypothetical protein
MTNNKILIRKASGESELFDVSKLKRSLQRAGSGKKTSESIAVEVEKSLFEGISTKKIYSMAFRILRKHNRKNALLYKLKQSLFELGPTGYPFEHFIGEIFRRRGYDVEVGKTVDGRCIAHEMDVIATNKQNNCLWNANTLKTRGNRYPYKSRCTFAPVLTISLEKEQRCQYIQTSLFRQVLLQIPVSLPIRLNTANVTV